MGALRAGARALRPKAHPDRVGQRRAGVGHLVRRGETGGPDHCRPPLQSHGGVSRDRFCGTQEAFAGVVLDAGAALPTGLARKAEGAPSRRFGVYRNNVYAGLIDVLAGRFPVVARLVGEEFFRAMARDYVEREPPSSAVLLRYGAGFADFIAGFPQAATVPYLADMAT